MHLRRISLENVRSFRERADLYCDGPMTILIGPNGGGKTNLLDSAVIMLRRHLFASMYAVHVPRPDNQDRYEFRHNDALNSLVLEKHSRAQDAPQTLEVEVEVTSKDLEAMRTLKDDADKIVKLAGKKYVNLSHKQAASWNVDQITTGDRILYKLENDGLVFDESCPQKAEHFAQFLKLYEMDSQIREDFDLSPLATPMIYLPVNRSANAINSNVDLAAYNSFEQKRQSDASISRTNFSLTQVAIGRLAQRHRILLDKDTGRTDALFKDDPNLIELTRILKSLGYEWNVVCTNPLKNTYDVKLSKQGTEFLVSRASSGERELLTYLFTIFALNVRDALILVDEPELHLHPRWQSILLNLFDDLSNSTGNQFLFATHSPKFVSPDSIQFVSRVYSENQQSKIVRLDASGLPNGKHLLNIVNSQNNERIFFADMVILVEGLSDRVFFEAVLNLLRPRSSGLIYEVVDVGGKGLFRAYQDLLVASKVPHVVIADQDYVEQIGNGDIKSLFALNSSDIKQDVLMNAKSMDGDALVQAIDKAIMDQSWSSASKVWEYIKSRRRMLRSNLTESEQAKLSQFLQEKRQDDVYVLSLGALEQYLPDGFQSKNLEKLIEFVSSDGFWERLPEGPRQEISDIVECILPTMGTDAYDPCDGEEMRE